MVKKLETAIPSLPEGQVAKPTGGWGDPKPETAAVATEEPADGFMLAAGATTAEESEETPPAEPQADESKKTRVPDPQVVGNKQLISYVERVERLEEERKTVNEDISELYAEVKGNGFDTKILREVIRRRKMDAAARAEHDSLLDTYEHAIR